MQFKTLLIDLDGVLRQWNDSDIPAEMAFGLPANEIAAVAFSPSLLTPAITGVITDQEWRARIAQELERRHEGCLAHVAVARWSQSPGTVDQSTLSLLQRCRGDLRLVLVTNATSRLTEDLVALGLTGVFDEVINSSELRVAKPADAFFRLALERAGVLANQALFIDDSVANVSAASALGIESHLFANHGAMAAFLRRHGVLNDPWR